MSVHKLKKICQDLKEDEPDMDKNFWAVNMHGDETNVKITVPKGIRIIMFCYSGRKLFVCPRFDTFNWKELFLNEDAAFNYCTFVANLTQYSSLRDHFCVYEEGSVINDLVLSFDNTFRYGVYKLPVKTAVYDEENKQVYLSSSDIFDKVIVKSEQAKKISVNVEKTAEIIKTRATDVKIFSPVIIVDHTKLSSLIKKIQFQEQKGFTLLLLTCRTGKQDPELQPSPTVYQELEKLFKKYQGISI